MGKKKILWKIEELWKKYYNSHTYYSCGGRSLKPMELIKNLYKDNISIYNPDFQLVKEFDFRKSKNIVHKDDYGEYFGLEKSQVLKSNGKLIYLFDNHNKILQPFLEYFEVTGKSFDVVHIDAHEDDAVFDKACLPAGRQKPQSFKLKNVQEYIKQTRISNFFDFLSGSSLRESETTCLPAGRSQVLINRIYRHTKSSDFKNFRKLQSPYVLSLDIDIFGPEGDFVDLESKVKTIAEAWGRAEVVCIAMSPGFIGQDFAKEIIRTFVK